MVGSRTEKKRESVSGFIVVSSNLELDGKIIMRIAIMYIVNDKRLIAA